jgi:hypothetical protein
VSGGCCAPRRVEPARTAPASRTVDRRGMEAIL